MIRVALITHSFPSREHPYIADWVVALADKLHLTIFTEQLPEADLPPRISAGLGCGTDVYSFNDVSRPVRSTLANWHSLTSILFRPPGVMRAVAAADGRQPWKTTARKVYEYGPWLGRQFDIVHFNAAQIAVRRFELGRLFGGKVVVSFRGQDLSHHAGRYDGLLERAHHLHFISRHLLGLARARGYCGSKHSVIPPAIDTVFYSPAPLAVADHASPRRFRLFTAARATWVKGWEFALQAVALLVEQGLDVEYRIATSGELVDMIIFTIHQLGLERRVRLLGWLSPEQVRDEMRQADLYVLSSVEEAFNNSVLQAQACGLAVVCSDAGGLPENIENGTTGLLARRRDAWDLAAKIRYLLLDEEQRRAMGRSARRRACEEFDLQTATPRFVEMYDLPTAGPGQTSSPEEAQFVAAAGR